MSDTKKKTPPKKATKKISRADAINMIVNGAEALGWSSAMFECDDIDDVSWIVIGKSHELLRVLRGDYGDVYDTGD